MESRPGDALTAEENVLEEAGVGRTAGQVGFVEGIAAHAIPVELGAGFLDALAVAVVSGGNARRGGKLVFGIVGDAGDAGTAVEVAWRIVAESAEAVVGESRNAEGFASAAGVGGRGRRNRGQIAPPAALGQFGCATRRPYFLFALDVPGHRECVGPSPRATKAMTSTSFRSKDTAIPCGRYSICSMGPSGSS